MKPRGRLMGRKAGVAVALALAAMPVLLAGCRQSMGGDDTAAPPARASKLTEETGSREYLRIGAALALTGPAKNSGRSMQRGIDLAVQELNASGGVGEKKLLVVFRDTHADGTAAQSAAEQLIEQDLADALISGAFPVEAEAMAEVAEDRRVPIVVPACAAAGVTLKEDGSVRDYVFRVCIAYDVQASATAYYAARALSAESVGIVWDETSEASHRLKESILSEFGTRYPEIEVSDELGYGSEAATGLDALVEQLRQDAFDTLILLGPDTSVAQLIQAIRDSGIQAHLLGWSQLSASGLIAQAGAAAEGVTLLSCFAPDERTDAVTAFTAAYEEAYKEFPETFAALAYDAVGILADALTRAGSVNPEAVARALEDTKDFPGAAGSTTIDAQHCALKRVLVTRVEKGKLRFARAITPSELTDAGLREPAATK